MKNKKIYFIAVLLLLALLIISIFTKEGKNSSKDKEITIAAASSLNKAFLELGKEFESKYKIKLTFVFGATKTHEEQLINGAPYDIIASADEETIVKLIENNIVINDSKKIFATGRIGICTLIENKKIFSLEELKDPSIKKIAIANPKTAPYGKASIEAMKSLDIYEDIKEKIVYAKNISDTLNYVATKNAEVGIISLSLFDKELHNFSLINEESHSKIIHSLGITKDSKNVEAANLFIDFIGSKEGIKIMNKYGYEQGE